MSLRDVKAKLAAAQICTDHGDWEGVHGFEDKAMLALVLAWHREHPDNPRHCA